MTSSQLASALEITAIAVRQHLQMLEAESMVMHTIRKGRVGRPAHVWHLTAAANAHFPDHHAELTLGLIDAVREAHGPEGLQAVLHIWAKGLADRSAESFGAGPEELRDRIAALVSMRREQGYMAEWSENKDGSFQLIENHCPIGDAACACDEICSGESMIFSRLLGEDVTVKRREHIPSGDRRCLYEIKKSS
ncbi:MAG: replication-relaxation family protein [Planctomycetes bacterium]|nr:replication-relaxation family protein [Planctomycetota bacterium]